MSAVLWATVNNLGSDRPCRMWRLVWQKLLEQHEFLQAISTGDAAAQMRWRHHGNRAASKNLEAREDPCRIH